MPSLLGRPVLGLLVAWSFRALSFAACSFGALLAQAPPVPREPVPTEPVPTEIVRLQERAFASDGAGAALATLADGIGARNPGGEALAAAVDYLATRGKAIGWRVTREPVMLPMTWQRGGAVRVRLVEPVVEELPAVSAFWSPSFGSADEPRRLAVQLQDGDGAALLMNAPAARRGGGSRRATERPARPAAELLLVDSGLPWAALASTRLPYAPPGVVGRRPAVFLRHEDAERLRRLHDAGVPPVVDVSVEARSGPPARVERIVLELPGKGPRAEQIVVGLAPIDSLDLGRGAARGGAAATLLHAAELLAGLPEAPARTLRFVFLPATTLGFGASRYAADHAEELPQHVAGFALPFAGAVRGMGLAMQIDTLTAAEAWFAPLQRNAELGVDDVGYREGPTGLPVGLQQRGVPVFELLVDGGDPRRRGTAADTVDKIAPADLQQATAVVASLMWSMALAAPPPRFASR